MLDRDDIADLLRLQSRGYRLLMWLDEQSVKTPELLSAAAVAQLSEADSAAVWMARERAAIPPELLPRDATGRLDVKQALDQLFFKNGERFFMEWWG